MVKQKYKCCKVCWGSDTWLPASSFDPEQGGVSLLRLMPRCIVHFWNKTINTHFSMVIYLCMFRSFPELKISKLIMVGVQEICSRTSSARVKCVMHKYYIIRICIIHALAASPLQHLECKTIDSYLLVYEICYSLPCKNLVTLQKVRLRKLNYLAKIEITCKPL